MKTTAIQVVPFIESTAYNVLDGKHHVTVEAQPEGPTEETTGWSVYERKEDGTVEWRADVNTENLAMIFGQKLAEVHGVAIEPQPWKLTSTNKTFRATVEIELITTSLHEAKNLLADRLGSIVGDDGVGIDDYRIITVWLT